MIISNFVSLWGGKYTFHIKAMKYQYETCGTCSRLIEIEIEDGVIADVQFLGGCHGNLQGISSLVKGMSPGEVVSKLDGIRCGNKQTSCPDQLSQALKSIMEKQV